MKKFILPLLFCLPLLSFIGDEWKEVNAENGIVVYNKDVTGSKFKKSMVKTTISYGSINQAEQILKDGEGYVHWQPNCGQGKVLHEEKNKVILYLTFDAPWPVSDRDLIIESTYKKHNNQLVVTNRCKPNYIPKKEDFVRITFSESSWIIEEKKDGFLYIQNTSHSSPGGNIPSWLLTSTVEDLPLQTLQGFIKQLK